MNVSQLWQRWRTWCDARRDRQRDRVLERALLYALEGRATDGCRLWRRWTRWRRQRNCDAVMRVYLDREIGDTRDAETTCRRWMRKAKSDWIRQQWLTELVELTLFHGRRDLIPEADAWTVELLQDTTATALIPMRKAYRGAVLVELGRWNEALPFLHEAAEGTTSRSSEIVAVHYLAKLHRDRGDTALAREWLDLAGRHSLLMHAGCVSANLEPLLSPSGE